MNSQVPWPATKTSGPVFCDREFYAYHMRALNGFYLMQGTVQRLRFLDVGVQVQYTDEDNTLRFGYFRDGSWPDE